MKKTYVAVIVSLLLFGSVSAQLTNANQELFYTQTASTIDPGQLQVFTDMNFFTKAGDFIGSSKPLDFKQVNYWLVAGNAVFAYGISENWDAALGIRVYQDTHSPNEFNLPGDMFLTVRNGNYSFGRNHFKAGFMTSFRIPTGKDHNYPFAEYASGSFEYGFLSAFSFYADPYLPHRSFSMHFNAGFWNHNENGKTLYTYANGTKLKATVNSKDYRMALAGVIPTAMFDFRLEMSGILYITPPDNFVYSAEEWAFLSPSIRYRAADWLSMDIGADFRISPKDRQQTTSAIYDYSTNLDLPPNYPDWKIHLGLTAALNLTGQGKAVSSDYVREEAKEKVDLFESVLDEKEKAKKVQQELENLRNVRKEAQKEIEDLKKELED